MAADPTVEDRLARLEAVEQIRQLKSEYCNICDAGHDPDRIIELFTDDGVWEMAEHGRFQGHEELRRAFASFGDAISFSQHNTTNLDVRMYDDRATGTWHFIGVVAAGDAAGRLTVARYDEEYVRVGAVWKIQYLRATSLARAALSQLTILGLPAACPDGMPVE